MSFSSDCCRQDNDRELFAYPTKDLDVLFWPFRGSPEHSAQDSLGNHTAPFITGEGSNRDPFLSHSLFQQNNSQSSIFLDQPSHRRHYQFVFSCMSWTKTIHPDDLLLVVFSTGTFESRDPPRLLATLLDKDPIGLAIFAFRCQVLVIETFAHSGYPVSQIGDLMMSPVADVYFD